MKNKTVIFGLISFSCLQFHAQTNVYTQNSTITYLNSSELNNPVTSTGVNIEIGTPTTTSYFSDYDKEVNACESVHLVNSTHLKAPVNGNLWLHTEEGKLNIVSYTHDDLTNVKALKKFETGVQIPQEIVERIELYKLNDQDPNGLNPFMEWDVALKISYKHIATGYSHFNYGFYYEDYVRNTNGPVTQWGWNEIAVNEPFRVRYAFPEKLGMWEIQYELYVDEQLYYSYCPFTLNITEKDADDGYVEVADNKRVLQRNDELFLPIGHNLKWPEYDGTCSYDPTGEPCESAAHVAFEQDLLNYQQSGQNYFRLMLSPVSFDIEFEKIGNYFERLNYAKEIDWVIEFAEEHDMYLDFNMLVHYGFIEGGVYGLYAWDWTDDDLFPWPYSYTSQRYCYASDLNLPKPGDFLTSTEAKKYYKQKLRYLISRYGYSTHIAMFELLSEINQVGDVFTTLFVDPPATGTSYQVKQLSRYDTEFTHRQNTYYWHKEMAEYVKNDLMHREHLLTCSYAGPIKDDDDSDLSFSIPEFDIISLNMYALSNLNHMSPFQNQIKQYHTRYDKPVIFGENGPLFEHDCDFGTTYIQQLWQTAFTGVAGFNYWVGTEVQNEPLWQEMLRLKSWILNDPLKVDVLLGNWKTGHAHSAMVNSYYNKEMNYIKEIGNADYVFGALQNLTSNYYTESTGSNSYCQTNLLLTNNFIQALGSKINLNRNDSPINNPWSTAPAIALIQWYDFETFSEIGSPHLWNTQNNVETEGFYHPYSCITGACEEEHQKSIMPFFGLAMYALETVPIENNFERFSNYALVQAEGNLFVQLKMERNQEFESEKDEPLQCYITNLLGQQIIKEDFSNMDQGFELNIDYLPTGYYFITFITNNNMETIKWLKF